MAEELEVTLVKKLEHKRIDCTCGIAVMPVDPTPDISEAIKRIVRESGAKFRILDSTVQPEVLVQYHIEKIPAVIINKKAYPADAAVVKKVLAEITPME